MASLRIGGALATMQKTIEDVQEAGGEDNQAQKVGDEQTEPKADEKKPEIQPVRVVPDEAVPFDRLALFTSTVLTPLANAAIIVVLVLFMLSIARTCATASCGWPARG